MASQHRIEQRKDQRVLVGAETAVLEFRGRAPVVRLVNISTAGAMVNFPHVPHIGEELVLRLRDRGQVPRQVRWVDDGRIGLAFAGGAAEML